MVRGGQGCDSQAWALQILSGPQGRPSLVESEAFTTELGGGGLRVIMNCWELMGL